MSSNPFRRAHISRPSDAAPNRDEAQSIPPPKEKSKKKRVVIQTPPHSPDEPSIPRRLSDGRTGSPPPPITTVDVDYSELTGNLELAQAAINKRRNSGSLFPPPAAFGMQPAAIMQPAARAPYNPFANTLATKEAELQSQSHRERAGSHDAAGGDAQSNHGPSRPALDVDTFKNILMTGSATPSPPTGQAQQLPRSQDNSSNTDASSLSKHSMFDPGNELHPESPRTSFDDHYSAYPTSSHSDDDDKEDERLSLMGPVASRPVEEGPPLPPKSARVPQTVSFADFEDAIPSNFEPNPKTPPLTTEPRPTAGTSTSKSLRDLNKPLPPSPEGFGNLSTRSEQNQITPLQPETAKSTTKKSPPPPPASRRQGQTGTTRGGRERSASNISQGSSSYPDSYVVNAASDEPTKGAPRPPPSRRTQPTSNMSSPGVEIPPFATTPDSASVDSRIMPPPPPPRNPSSSKTSATLVTRTPSNASHTSLLRPDSNSVIAAGNTAAPPAPPPRRGGPKRNSTDGPSKFSSTRRASGADFRRSSGQSFSSDRSFSMTNLQQVVEPAVEDENATASVPPKSDHDILADMTAFQAEIEALRAQALRGE